MFPKFLLSLCQLLRTENQIENVMRFILLTDFLEAAGLSVEADTVSGVEACVVHRTFEKSQVIQFAGVNDLLLTLFCSSVALIRHRLLYQGGLKYWEYAIKKG